MFHIPVLSMRKAKIITQTRENPAGTQLYGPVFCPALSVAFFGEWVGKNVNFHNFTVNTGGKNQHRSLEKPPYPSFQKYLL